MTTKAARRSNLHDMLEELHPTWTQIHGMPAALHFGNPAGEVVQSKVLAICDASTLPRMGIKGRGGDKWVLKHGITPPQQLYGHAEIPGGGLILRTGTSELFLEDSVPGNVVTKLWVDSDANLVAVYRFHRQDAAMLLSGKRAVEVLAQSCGYNFAEPDANLVFSRVAGVSCCIFRNEQAASPLFRIWCDGSFAAYLWEQLHEITCDLGGAAIGISSFYSVA